MPAFYGPSKDGSGTPSVRPRESVKIEVKTDHEDSPVLFQADTRPSCSEGWVAYLTEVDHNANARMKMEMPTFIRNADGAIVGAIISQSKALPPYATENPSCVIYTTSVRDGVQPVQVTLPDGFTVDMYAWALQAAVGNEQPTQYIHMASGADFMDKPKYAVIGKYAGSAYQPYPITIKSTKSGQAVANAKVKLSPDKYECWYEMSVASGMDISLLAMATTMYALNRDEITYKTPGIC